MIEPDGFGGWTQEWGRRGFPCAEPNAEFGAIRSKAQPAVPTRPAEITVNHNDAAHAEP